MRIHNSFPVAEPPPCNEIIGVLRPTNMNWAAMVFWFQHGLVFPRFLVILEKKEEAEPMALGERCSWRMKNWKVI